MKKLLIIAALGMSFALPSQALVCRTATCAKFKLAQIKAAIANPPAPKPYVPPVVIVRPDVVMPDETCMPSVIEGGVPLGC